MLRPGYHLFRLREAAERCDLALGSRYIPEGGTRGWAFRRRLLSRSENVYARWLTGVPVADLTGGFKCYRRNVLESSHPESLRSEGYAFQIESTVRASRAGFKIREVPIVFRERAAGVSKLSGPASPPTF